MILAYFGQNLVAIATSVKPLQSQMSYLDWLTTKNTPVIRNHIPVVSCRNAFIAILVPKLVAMVTLLYPLCTGVSHMNSLIAQTLCQDQTLLGYDA